jgi:hypothetical protein
MGLTQNLGLLSTAIKATSTLNVGIGVTPFAWAGTNIKGLDISLRGALSGGTTDVAIINNAFYNGSAWIYKETASASFYQQLTGIHRWFTAPSGTAGNTVTFSEKMTLTESGSLGINTTSPAFKLSVAQDLTMDSDVTSAQFIISGSSNAGKRLIMGYDTNSNGFGFIKCANQGVVWSPLVLQPNGGNVLVGTTTDSGQKMTVNGNIIVSLAGSAHLFLDTTPFGGAYAYNMQIKNNAGNGNFYIQRTSDGTGVYIPFGGTSWGGVSDERLKTDLVEIENATEKVSQLRTVTGRFKTDEVGKSRSFFIAQDMQKVFPEAVNYDEENDVWGIQYTDTIPLMAAAIKELKAEIDALKNK